MSIRERLKADLLAARKAGDAESVDEIRILLAAIGNAEAVELDASHPREVEGWGDVPRRHLTADDLAGIIRREAQELRSAADDFERRGRPDEAARLRSRARLVDRYLADLG
ncbi:MAG TPA: GatB/YqeY domain-containing protein [Acidimicrobiia bacterium]|nr:GatB/YqeY domain-containing protein [Acidimicrobiia bacterium]